MRSTFRHPYLVECDWVSGQWPGLLIAVSLIQCRDHDDGGRRGIGFTGRNGTEGVGPAAVSQGPGGRADTLGGGGSHAAAQQAGQGHLAEHGVLAATAAIGAASSVAGRDDAMLTSLVAGAATAQEAGTDNLPTVAALPSAPVALLRVVAAGTAVFVRGASGSSAPVMALGPAK